MISEAIVQSALQPKHSITEAVNILMEADKIAGGTRVAILDDGSGTCGVEGVVGKVRGPSANKVAGFLDVELPNGTVVPVPANLLLPA